MIWRTIYGLCVCLHQSLVGFPTDHTAISIACNCCLPFGVCLCLKMIVLKRCAQSIIFQLSFQSCVSSFRFSAHTMPIEWLLPRLERRRLTSRGFMMMLLAWLTTSNPYAMLLSDGSRVVMMPLARSIKDLNLVNLIRVKHKQYVSRDAFFHEEQGRNDNASPKNQNLGFDNLACLKYKGETLSWFGE